MSFITYTYCDAGSAAAGIDRALAVHCGLTAAQVDCMQSAFEHQDLERPSVRAPSPPRPPTAAAAAATAAGSVQVAGGRLIPADAVGAAQRGLASGSRSTLAYRELLRSSVGDVTIHWSSRRPAGSGGASGTHLG